jgi:NADH-quinone oxidoreductase subunit A
MNNLNDFLYVFIFIAVAVAFAALPIIIARLIAPKSLGKTTLETYECGIKPVGSAWIRYSVYYYIYALIFIAFDVDILYLFPAALSYTKGSNMEEYYSLIVFILILALAVIYAWRKGVFTWKRRIPS